jgi:hypothetical protein
MAAKVYFSKKGEGWSEVKVPVILKSSSDEELTKWAYKILDNGNYKSYLISENPNPYPIYNK